MFLLEPMIDTIQNGKKTFIKTFVTNEKIAKSLHDFVDAQTVYTKEANKATTDMITNVMSEAVKSVQDLGKFDYMKFGEGIMKGYYTQVPKK
jgi:hypothetical protein